MRHQLPIPRLPLQPAGAMLSSHPVYHVEFDNKLAGYLHIIDVDDLQVYCQIRRDRLGEGRERRLN